MDEESLKERVRQLEAAKENAIAQANLICGQLMECRFQLLEQQKRREALNTIGPAKTGINGEPTRA